MLLSGGKRSHRNHKRFFLFFQQHYQEKEVCQLEYSLRSFLDLFSASGFVQIGKSMAVNMYKIDKIQADLNMHLKLRLDNGELLILNRGYKKSIFETLQHVREVHYEAD